MSEITTVGLDLAKRIVSLCGEDAAGQVVVQRSLRREAVLAWFVQRPACVVGMEACASAHWFARELIALCHPAATGNGPRSLADDRSRPRSARSEAARQDRYKCVVLVVQNVERRSGH